MARNQRHRPRRGGASDASGDRKGPAGAGEVRGVIPARPAGALPGTRWILLGAALVGLAMAVWLWWPRRVASGAGAGAGGGGAVPAVPAAAAGAGPVIEPEAAVFGRYAGSASCRECHTNAFAAWSVSNHGMAERSPSQALDLAAFDPPRSFAHGSQRTSVGSSNGVFTIASLGPGGSQDPRPVARVIGHHPLRQYLVEAPGGRWQTLEASWDPRTNDWFNVYGDEDRQPGEWGHWSGRGMNWNAMCGTCHNTRYRKNYDPATDAFHTTMAEMTVGCEACHGPMRDHVSWQRAWPGKKNDPTLRKPTAAQSMESCAPCHARRSEITGDFAPGDSFWDHYLLAIVDESDVYYPDGQVRDENYEYAAFLGSRMHAAGVTCLDCHDPHAARPKIAGNDLCLRCHNGSRAGSPIIDPVKHSFHQPGSTGAACVNCHMPQTPYMQRHWRHDHGFTSPDPVLTLESGIPNACNRCHADKDAAWAREACEKWYGARMERPARARTRAFAAARRGEVAAVPRLLGLLDGPEVPYWKASAIALLDRWSDRREVGGAFLRQLAHEHPLVRYRAVQGLAPFAEAGDPAVTAALRPRLQDASRAVRFSAAWALRREVSADSTAGRELRHSLVLNADQPTGQAQLGVYELARGNAEAAVGHYARAVAWDPRFARPAAGLRRGAERRRAFRRGVGADPGGGAAGAEGGREPLSPRAGLERGGGPGPDRRGLGGGGPSRPASRSGGASRGCRRAGVPPASGVERIPGGTKEGAAGVRSEIVVEPETSEAGDARSGRDGRGPRGRFPPTTSGCTVGAERGAYTGADRRRTGLVAAAQDGTLFLDEIGEVPLGLQAKLLRFLESREYRPLGAVASQRFSGRLVAATNKPLRAEVAAGRFREDLLFRIEVFAIAIPPLRERREDIPALAEQLLAGLAGKYGRTVPLLREADLTALHAHDFPGNIRELRNILERALLRTPADHRWLTLDPSWLGGVRTPGVSVTSPASPGPLPPVPASAPVGSGADEGLPPERADLTALEAQEYRLIRAVLRETRGGIRRTAVKVGLSPQALLRRLEKWPELRLPAS
jgi:predicted ATP-dependent protease